MDLRIPKCFQRASLDGIRSVITFPTCWDGESLDGDNDRGRLSSLTLAIETWPSMVLCRAVDNTLDCRKRMFWPATPIHRHSWRGHIRSPTQRISPPCSLEPVAPAQRDFRDNASCDIRSERCLWTDRRSRPRRIAIR